MKHIPNILSIIRILLVGVFAYTIFCVNPVVAMIVFVIAGATDVVDGYLARRYNWITDLGKILDPVADKLMQCTAMICLYLKDLIPVWFMIPFFVKEILTIVSGFLVIKKRNFVVVSKWYGKLTVCLFYAAIVLSVFMADTLKANPTLNILVFAPAVIGAVFSFIAYFTYYAKITCATPKEETKEEKTETADAAENI